MAVETNTASPVVGGESFYRRLVQNLPGVAILVFDRNLRYVAAEGRFLSAAGFTANALIGKTMQEVLSAEARERLLPFYQKALAGHKSEFEGLHGQVHYRSHIAPLRSGPGEIVGGIIASYDITAQKNAEQALVESEAQIRLRSEYSSDIVAQISRDGSILYISPSCERVFGYRPAEMIGKITEDFIHPADIELVQKSRVVMNLPEHDLTGPLLIRFRHKDGHYLWIERTGQSIYAEPAHELTGFFVSFRDVTDRLRIEQALRNSEARYRLMAENNSDVVIQMDAAGVYLYVSPSSERVLGYRPAELIGKTTADFFHPDGDENFQPGRRVLRTKPESLALRRCRFRHKDGHYLWIERSAQPVYAEPAHDLTGYIVSFRDVTERQQVEQALWNSEARYRLLAENSSDVVIEMGPTFIMTYVSPACERVLGFTPEEMIGYDMLDFAPAEDVPAIIKSQNAWPMSSGPEKPFTIRLRHKHGHDVWVERTGQPVYSNQSGERSGYMATLRDITDRHHAEQALKASEFRLRTMVEKGPDAVILGDGHDKALDINPAACAMFGYTHEEFQKKGYVAFVDQTDPRFKAFITERDQTGISSAELTGIRQGGIPFPVFATSLVFTEPDGAERSWSIFRDLTAQKRNEQSIVDQEALRVALAKETELTDLKARMMERMAHEFRTPLSVVQATIETLVEYVERLTPKQRHDKSEKIRVGIQRLTDMLDEISLVVADRLVAERMHYSDVDLCAVCSEVAHELEAKINRPNSYRLDCPQPLIAHCDSDAVHTALTHVMRNAVRYSTAADPVEVRLSRDDRGALIQVTDRGLGIPPAEQSRLFEPFFRGSNIGEVGGLGLGLTIARQCIEAQHGTIDIESNPGQGTTVTIRLA